jgi:hypothetical protein
MKLRVASLACAGLFAVAVGCAAGAEPPIGSRVGERLEKQKNQSLDDRDAAQAAHQLAGCILAKRGNAGRDLLMVRSEGEVKQLQSRMDGELECLANLPGNDFVEQVGVTFPPDVLRGDLAEELLKRDRRGLAALQPLPIQKVYSRSWFEFTGRDVRVDEMAACVADTGPAAILALVDTQPFSDAEGAAFGNLLPYMGPCLRAGTKLSGKREPLRAALAEALYQRLSNPSESVVAPTRTAAAPAQD